MRERWSGSQKKRLTPAARASAKHAGGRSPAPERPRGATRRPVAPRGRRSGGGEGALEVGCAERGSVDGGVEGGSVDGGVVGPGGRGRGRAGLARDLRVDEGDRAQGVTGGPGKVGRREVRGEGGQGVGGRGGGQSRVGGEADLLRGGLVAHSTYAPGSRALCGQRASVAAARTIGAGSRVRRRRAARPSSERVSSEPAAFARESRGRRSGRRGRRPRRGGLSGRWGRGRCGPRRAGRRGRGPRRGRGRRARRPWRPRGATGRGRCTDGRALRQGAHLGEPAA